MTPGDVQNAQFKRAFRGYDEIEVDAFLDQVEIELGRLIAENEDLRQRLAAAASAPPPEPNAEAEAMLRRTLLLAQRTADETVAQARAEAERVTTESRAQARALLQQAQAQAHAQFGDLEQRRQQLEQQIEALRAFEREYRTRLRAYLENQLRDLDARGQAPAPPAAAGGGAPPGPPAAPPARPATASAGDRPTGEAPPPAPPPVSPVRPEPVPPDVLRGDEPDRGAPGGA